QCIPPAVRHRLLITEMKMNKEFSGWLSAFALPLIMAGCATSGTHQAASESSNGVELWSRNCGHCHNLRPPESYSPAQWDVAMLHMRVRANLTAREHAAILEFLQSASAAKGRVPSGEKSRPAGIKDAL